MEKLMLPFARQNPVRLIFLCAVTWACAGQAAPQGSTPLPDEVVQKLITHRYANIHASAAETLLPHLDDLAVILQPVAQRAAALSASEITSADDSQQMLIESKRNELKVSRTQIQAELADTHRKLSDLNVPDKVIAHAHFMAEVDKRFKRLDMALADVSSAKKEHKHSAVLHAQQELSALQGPPAALNLGIDGNPVPTWRQDIPPPYQAVPLSKSLPAYLIGAAPDGHSTSIPRPNRKD
jgi:hypothetical protein